MSYPEHQDDKLPRARPHIRTHWVVVAETVNRTLAEFAANGLKSYEIPAVIDMRPGFLGTAGLLLRSLRDGRPETFKIMVPGEFEEEASEVVKIFLGDNCNDECAEDSEDDLGGDSEETSEYDSEDDEE